MTRWPDSLAVRGGSIAAVVALTFGSPVAWASDAVPDDGDGVPGDSPVEPTSPETTVPPVSSVPVVAVGLPPVPPVSSVPVVAVGVPPVPPPVSSVPVVAVGVPPVPSPVSSVPSPVSSVAPMVAETVATVPLPVVPKRAADPIPRPPEMSSGNAVPSERLLATMVVARRLIERCL